MVCGLLMANDALDQQKLNSDSDKCRDCGRKFTYTIRTPMMVIKAMKAYAWEKPRCTDCTWRQYHGSY